MPPRDRPVLWRLEGVVERVAPHQVVDAADQASSDGDAGQHGQVALGDAEGHVRAARVSPLGDDMPTAQDQTVRTLTWPHGPEHVAGRLGLVGDADVSAGCGEEITPPARLVGEVMVNRGAQRRRVEADLTGLARLPLV